MFHGKHGKARLSFHEIGQIESLCLSNQTPRACYAQSGPEPSASTNPVEGLTGGITKGNLGGMSVNLEKVRVPKLKTSVALSKDVLHEAHQVAREHKVSLSEYITRLLRADLDERKNEGKE